VNSFILSRNSGTILQYTKILYMELFSLFYFYLIYFILFIDHKIMSNTLAILLDYILVVQKRTEQTDINPLFIK
jgi:hypothetical protein